MKRTSLWAIAALLLTTFACGEKEPKTLEEKKAKLAQLQSEQSTLNASIKALQSEIDKLSPAKAIKVKSVATQVVTTNGIDHYVETTGRLDAINNVLVSPQMGGAIAQILVKEGDMVAKGQKLAVIDNTVMRNSIQEVLIQLETAKTIFERQKALWDQKIGTEVQYIQAKAQVEGLEKRLATLKSQDAMNIVTAPISGMVDEVRFKAGELAAPGLGILRLVNSGSLKVVANVPDTYAGTLSIGNKAVIRFPDLNKEVISTISFVSQTINPTSRTFTVEAKVPAGDRDLKPNLTAEVRINDQRRPNAISIYENVVQRTDVGDIVYVAVKEGNGYVARQRKVTKGLSYNGLVEITQGLSAGEMLITEGYQELVDGQAIQF
ncbi:MAG: efflux RND transporter periplasmic adaptor subunit [Spirosomataceae bacterium]